MPVIPFFPSLKPHTANHIWFDIDAPCNEDAEVLALERENTNEVNAISNLGQDLNPIGKALTMVGGGPETDDEDANDDTDDSDSHDDEDDEIDRLMDSVNNRTPIEDDAGNTSNNDDDVSTLILQHSI